MNTVNRGLYRLRVPSWDNAKFAAPCQFACPTGIPTQERLNLIRQGKIDEALKLILKYTPFPGSICGTLCPNPCMENYTRSTINEAIQIGALGLEFARIEFEPPKISTDKSVGIIGGKLTQVIPYSRISSELIQSELKRLENIGVKFITNYKVDAEKFQSICAAHDAILVATGGTKARYFDREGAQKITVVDVQKPAAFAKEIRRRENFGGKIIYLFMTKK